MGDTTGKAADGIHTPDVLKLVFQIPLVGDIGNQQNGRIGFRLDRKAAHDDLASVKFQGVGEPNHGRCLRAPPHQGIDPAFGFVIEQISGFGGKQVFQGHARQFDGCGVGIDHTPGIHFQDCLIHAL